MPLIFKSVRYDTFSPRSKNFCIVLRSVIETSFKLSSKTLVVIKWLINPSLSYSGCNVAIRVLINPAWAKSLASVAALSWLISLETLESFVLNSGLLNNSATLSTVLPA